MSGGNGTPRLSPHAAASATSQSPPRVVLVEPDFASGPFAALLRAAERRAFDDAAPRRPVSSASFPPSGSRSSA